MREADGDRQARPGPRIEPVVMGRRRFSAGFYPAGLHRGLGKSKRRRYSAVNELAPSRFHQTIEDRMFMRFIIQSANHSSFELKRRVDDWLKGVGDLFDNLTDEEFERHRASRIVSLEKQGESIGEVMGDLYYLATEEKGDFDYKKKLIHAVKNLKKEDVITDGRKWLLDKSTSRLVILIRSKNNDEPVPEGVISEVSQFKNRRGAEANATAPMGTGS